MSKFRAILRAYAKTLVVFASWHLVIIVWYAAKNNSWHLLQIGEIWDIRYLLPTYTASAGSEFVLVLIVVIVFLYFWFRERKPH